jgi:Family of unknown function (DUF6282)
MTSTSARTSVRVAVAAIGVALLTAAAGAPVARTHVTVSQDGRTARAAEGARVLAGAIDLHFHMDAPAVAGRGGQATIALVRAARARGLRALVLKNHYEPTATLAYQLRLEMPDFPLFGGIVMNRANGGMNAAAVEYMANHIAGSPGRIVWMPAGDTESEVKVSANPGGPFVAVARNGQLSPETRDVLGVIGKDHRLILASGHIPAGEALLLFAEAKHIGITHMIATHGMDFYPGDKPTKMTIPEMQQAAKLGAFVEFDMRNIFNDGGVRADAIRAIGPESCFISEFWTRNNPREYGDPDAMGAFVEKMKAKGFRDYDLDLMFKINPAKLLELQ